MKKTIKKKSARTYERAALSRNKAAILSKGSKPAPGGYNRCG